MFLGFVTARCLDRANREPVKPEIRARQILHDIVRFRRTAIERYQRLKNREEDELHPCELQRLDARVLITGRILARYAHKERVLKRLNIKLGDHSTDEDPLR